jgi:hypothetical protein
MNFKNKYIKQFSLAIRQQNKQIELYKIILNIIIGFFIGSFFILFITLFIWNFYDLTTTVPAPSPEKEAETGLVVWPFIIKIIDLVVNRVLLYIKLNIKQLVYNWFLTLFSHCSSFIKENTSVSNNDQQQSINDSSLGNNGFIKDTDDSKKNKETKGGTFEQLEENKEVELANMTNNTDLVLNCNEKNKQHYTVTSDTEITKDCFQTEQIEKPNSFLDVDLFENLNSNSTFLPRPRVKSISELGVVKSVTRFFSEGHDAGVTEIDKLYDLFQNRTTPEKGINNTKLEGQYNTAFKIFKELDNQNQQSATNKLLVPSTFGLSPYSSYNRNNNVDSSVNKSLEIL